MHGQHGHAWRGWSLTVGLEKWVVVNVVVVVVVVVVVDHGVPGVTRGRGDSSGKRDGHEAKTLAL